MSDLISREGLLKQIEIDSNEEPGYYGDTWKFIDTIKNMPSAQPEKHTKKRTETHACDLISRQAAIDAILAVTGNSSVRELYEHVQEHGLSDMWSGGVNAAIDIIIAVPPVQPERESIKWIPHESIFGGPDERVYTCDKCGYNIGFHVENFCPNCGGKYERYEKKEGER